MPFLGLREFSEYLESNGQLLRIKETVRPEPDISSAAFAVLRQGGKAPAILFENIEGYKTPLLMNVHGSWYNHALMLEMDKEASIKDQFFELDTRWGKEPIKSEWTDTAPCKENKLVGNINLFDLLPLFRINKYDAGCFLSKASVITRDPEFPDDYNRQNVGIYRLQVKGRDRLAIQALGFHDFGLHLRKAEKMGVDLPVSIALGNDPIITFMGGTPLEYTESEYDFASVLRGAPCLLTKAENSNNDVPAGAEFVLEGVVKPGIRTVEGPFGEFPGSYSGSRLQTEVVINTVTHRSEPIFENLYLGRPWSEVDYLLALNTSVPLYKQLKQNFPEVVAVNAMYTHGMGVVISTHSRFGGFAKSVALRLLSTPHGMPYSKIIVLVDADVDPFNLEQVMWAMTVRVDPERDVNILKNMPGMPLDPSSYPPGMHSKLIIDATTPVYPERLLADTNMISEPPDVDKWERILKNIALKRSE